MCWEDVKIDRSLKTKLYSSTGALTIPGNPNRIAIRMTCDFVDPASNAVATFTLSAVQGVEGGTNTAQPVLGMLIAGGGVDVGGAPQAIAGPVETTIRLADVGGILCGQLRVTPSALSRWYLWESSLETEGPPTLNYGNH